MKWYSMCRQREQQGKGARPCYVPSHKSKKPVSPKAQNALIWSYPSLIFMEKSYRFIYTSFLFIYLMIANYAKREVN